MNTEMVMIKWVGETREVPGYGVGRTNENIIVPSDMAASFKEQGLAIDIEKAVATKKAKALTGGK